MYEEYLGKGYHEVIRKIIGVDDKLCPDKIIDADLNIGPMKRFIAPAMEKMIARGKTIDSEAKYAVLETAARHYLAGVLCVALKSRTSAPPFNAYKRNWDKKRAKCMDKANRLMLELMQMG